MLYLWNISKLHTEITMQILEENKSENKRVQLHVKTCRAVTFGPPHAPKTTLDTRFPRPGAQVLLEALERLRGAAPHTARTRAIAAALAAGVGSSGVGPCWQGFQLLKNMFLLLFLLFSLLVLKGMDHYWTFFFQGA